MNTKLRVVGTSLTLVLGLGLGLTSSLAYAEARPVGGDKATWDKACKADKNCMPIGDLGDGINGYFVHDGNGGGTSVWFDDDNCAAERGTSPKKSAQDMQPHPAALSASSSAPAVKGNETTKALLKMQ